MTITLIDELGPIPLRSQDPDTFITNADGFLGDIPGFRTQANALATEVNASAQQVAADTFTAVAAANESTSSKDTAVEQADIAVSNANVAIATLNDLQTRYLGAFNEEPLTNFNGEPVSVGALYFNVITGKLRAYTSGGWVDTAVAAPASFTQNLFSGDGVETVFTMTTPAATSQSVFVNISGVQQRFTTDFMVDQFTLTFVEAPPVGTDNIQVLIFAPINVGVPDDGAVTPSKLSAGHPSWTEAGDFSFGTSKKVTGRNSFEDVNSVITLIEKASIFAVAASNTIIVTLGTSSVWYLTVAATANWTFNFRESAGVLLNDMMDIGQVVSCALLITNGATAYRATAFQIDGVAITPKWQNGVAPSAGNANSIDVYSFNIVKTAENTFTVLASLSRFA